jgi:hypothetical protein
VGQRANLVLVEAGNYQLFYSHWCANTLPRDLFWGPDHAAAFIGIQRPVEKTEWLDEVWAEGGAIVDLDQRHFMLFGGEDLLWEVPLRRIYMRLLTQVWKGWTVSWAYEGIAGLADYVGYPREKVLATNRHDGCGGVTLPETKEWTDLVASLRLGDGTFRFYPLSGDAAAYLSEGPELVPQFRELGGFPQLDLNEWSREFPRGGLHIDLSDRTLDYWIAEDSPDIQNRVAAAWQGWRTEWHHDQYEMQLERTAGNLQFPAQDQGALLHRCREMLLVERGAVDITEVAKLLVKGGVATDVQMNASALRDDRLHVPRERRLSILNEIEHF